MCCVLETSATQWPLVDVLFVLLLSEHRDTTAGLLYMKQELVTVVKPQRLSVQYVECSFVQTVHRPQNVVLPGTMW